MFRYEPGFVTTTPKVVKGRCRLQSVALLGILWKLRSKKTWYLSISAITFLEFYLISVWKY